jgi:hypothetical protein
VEPYLFFEKKNITVIVGWFGAARVKITITGVPVRLNCKVKHRIAFYFKNPVLLNHSNCFNERKYDLDYKSFIFKLGTLFSCKTKMSTFQMFSLITSIIFGKEH